MALDIHASDEEKSEAIKQWWRENARAIAVGIIIGLLGIFGVRSWMEYRQNRVQEASTIYQQILAAKTQKANIELYDRAEDLVQDYADTPYGVFSALMLAKEDQARGNFNAAIERLTWALEHTKNLGFRRIVNLRLARLMLAQGNPEKALAVLAEVEPGSFSSAYVELRGDIHVHLGQLSKARLAYQQALGDVELSDQRQQLLRMKLDNIAQS